MIPVSLIQGVVAAEFKIPSAKMVEPINRGLGRDSRNNWDYAHPRQVAMYLARKLTTHSSVKIGRMFGGRDHSTVLHAIKATGKRIAEDEKFAERIWKLEQALTSQSIPLMFVKDFKVTTEEHPRAWRHPKPDWRAEAKEEQKRQIRAPREIMGGHTHNVRDEDRVHRDPCIKCGVRGDIGCVHTRVAA